MSAVPHQFHFLLNGKEHCVLWICAENMRDPPGETLKIGIFLSICNMGRAEQCFQMLFQTEFPDVIPFLAQFSSVVF